MLSLSGLPTPATLLATREDHTHPKTPSGTHLTGSIFMAAVIWRSRVPRQVL